MKDKWTVVYNIKMDQEIGVPVLPKPTASRSEQGAAVRALRVLYPEVKVTLFSVRRRGGSRIVKELRV